MHPSNLSVEQLCTSPRRQRCWCRCYWRLWQPCCKQDGTARQQPLPQLAWQFCCWQIRWRGGAQPRGRWSGLELSQRRPCAAYCLVGLETWWGAHGPFHGMRDGARMLGAGWLPNSAGAACCNPALVDMPFSQRVARPWRPAASLDLQWEGQAHLRRSQRSPPAASSTRATAVLPAPAPRACCRISRHSSRWSLGPQRSAAARTTLAGRSVRGCAGEPPVVFMRDWFEFRGRGARAARRCGMAGCTLRAGSAAHAQHPKSPRRRVAETVGYPLTPDMLESSATMAEAVAGLRRHLGCS